MKEKHPYFQMPVKRLHAWSLFNIWVRIYLFLKNYVTSEVVVSHNVLYYQQLSNAPYQVSFEVYNCFE